MRDCKPEVEARGHSRHKSYGEMLLARPNTTPNNPSIYMKEVVDRMPDFDKLNANQKKESILTGPTADDSFKVK
jgi:hypothetical protein